jgi:hypothetical protein
MASREVSTAAHGSENQCCGSESLNPDPDPAFHANPDPALMTKNLKKSSADFFSFFDQKFQFTYP